MPHLLDLLILNPCPKLKVGKNLPIAAYQCGLITKSDAERLYALLLEGDSLARFDAKAAPFSFR